ncbi:MAG: hypothetical protein OEV41_05465, partial [Gammaproteobacteria bacterium]|nr:hypothetical protein [Gammaproteobacteria bacterium]
RSITGSGGRLIVLGRVSYIGEDFISVLGQSVFLGRDAIDGLSLGSAVAIYGEIDIDTGGIVGASVDDAAQAGFDSGASFLTGIVDSVDFESGTAIVGGKAVNYTALLSNGAAPSAGDIVSIAGRDYGDAGLLIADPDIRLER